MLIAPVDAVEPRGIIGIDVIARRLRRSGVARRRRRCVGRDRQPSVRAMPSVPRGVSRISPAIDDPGDSRGAPCGPGLIERRRAILGDPARAEQSGFAEQIDIRQRRLLRGPARAGARPVPARATGRSHCAGSAAATRRSISSSRNASCAGAISVSQACSLICCSSTSPSNGWCSASVPPRQQPDRQRRGEARKRHRRECRHDGCALRHVAFERHCEAAGDQARDGCAAPDGSRRR